MCQGEPGKATEEKSVINPPVSTAVPRGGGQIDGPVGGAAVRWLTPRASKSGRSLVGPMAAGALLVLLAAACAAFTCRPLSLTVAEKEERSRLDMVPRGMQTTGSGRLEVLRTPEIVRDYWVRAEDGTWYPVPLDKFQAAEVGRPLELCR